MGKMMSRFENHFGHDIVIAKYTDGIVEPTYAVECEDCYEVLIDDEVIEMMEAPFQPAAPGSRLGNELRSFTTHPQNV